MVAGSSGEGRSALHDVVKGGLDMWSIAERFNARLQQDGERGRQALAELAAMVERDPTLRIHEGATVFLRPGFLTAADQSSLDRDIPALYRLMLSVPDRLFGGDPSPLCDMIGLNPFQREAVLATWWDQDVQLGRADLMRDETGFRLPRVRW